MKHYVSPDLENKPDLVTVQTGNSDLKSVRSSEEIISESISVSLFVKKQGH